MTGVPPLAPETIYAQSSPLQTWVDGWLGYLSANLPIVFLVVAVAVGILLLARAGIKQTVIFAVGAALAWVLLTNLESVATFLERELPLPSVESVLPSEAPEPPSDAEPTQDGS